MVIKLVFFSSSEISLPLLRALNADARFNILYVVCQPDKTAGRSLMLKKNQVKTSAEKMGLRVLQPEKLLSNDFLSTIKSADADILLTFAYGKILPKDVLKSAKIAPINIHASLLPKYRGASPIQASILNGDNETGITIMKMVEKMDAGPIFKVYPIAILEHFTAGLLHDCIADKAAEFVPDELAKINASSVFTEQDEACATNTVKIVKEDGFVDFKCSAKELMMRFKAYTPWPGLWTTYENKRLKLIDLCPSNEVLAPGEIKCYADKILVGTADGSILLNEIQLESKNTIHAKQFVIGYPDFCRTSLPS